MGHRRPVLTPRGTVSSVLVVVVLAVTALASGALPWRLQRVASGSMAPTVEVGDLLLVGPVGSAAAGSVVVARDPAGGPDLVKRVVAVGGQTVRIDDGVLLVDGQQVCDRLADRSGTDGDQGGPWPVPVGAVFLLGDARVSSVDSRDTGPFPLTALRGTVLARAWPDLGPLPDPGC